MPDSLSEILKTRNARTAASFIGTPSYVRPALPVNEPVQHLDMGEWRDFGFMFARESLPVQLGMTIWEQSERKQFPALDGYDPFIRENFEGYESFAPLLGSARSPEEFQYRKSLADERLRELAKARRTVLGNVGGFAGGLANVSSLIPVSRLVGRTALTTGSVKGGLQTARNLGFITLAEQTALQALDGTRNDSEVLNTVGFAFLVGGAIGAWHVRSPAKNKIIRDLHAEITRQDADMAKKASTVLAQDADLQQAFKAADEITAGLNPKTGAGGPSGAGTAARKAELAGNRPAPTAAWLDKLPDNPIKRLLQSGSLAAQRAVARMADIGFYQSKNLDEGGNIPTSVSAWTRYKTTWVPAAVEAKKETERLFVALRKRLAAEAKSAQPADNVLKIRVRDALDRITGSTPGMMTFEQFLEAVGRAKAGAKNYPEEVLAAAQAWDTHVYKPLAEHGAKSGVFKSEVYKPDYLNRIYLIGKVKQYRNEFINVLMRYGRTNEDAAKIADNIINGKPLENSKASFGDAAAIHERELGDIPDEALEKFLERNIYVAGDKYARTVGIDSELATSLGNANFNEVLKEIGEEYKKLIAAADDPLAKKTLMEEQKAVVEDMTALRELLRGTYGIPQDPTRFTSRAMRFMKNFNAMTQLTGGLVALTDVGTLVLSEGLGRTFDTAFASLFKNLDSFKLAKKEAQLAGEAIELYAAMRAGGIADLTEDLGDITKLEHWVQRATNAAFVLNGLNIATDTVKAMASMVVGTRILEDAIASVSKGAAYDAAKLARAGISRDMAAKIAAQAQAHGLRIGKTFIANTDLWTDQGAVKAFRAALSKDINFAVITPQPGEKPLWMSRELGSFLGQYRGYSVAALQKVAMTGLQRPEMAQLGGLAVLVGMGAMIDNLRASQNDAPASRDFGTRLKGAIDRSGVLGYIGDINNVFETLNDNRFGLGALIGADGYPSSTQQKMGALFGPSVNTWGNMYRVMNDATFGDWSDASAKSARRLLYLQNTAHFDWLFDAAQKGMAPAQPQVLEGK